ncbi:MAG: glutamate synthase small subunit [Bacteroidetes bacterium]|jgi:glutamate synthase (NADPH/NADH) small chain|nr:glutamate synthase small subunit [Bacteroidota bacterium]
MGNPKGFMEVVRQQGGYRPTNERINDFSEVEKTLNENDRKLQASRCMDCGIPFCQWGCPVINNMPEWQDAIYKGDWKLASENLHETNNFPEFTGKVCPAPCEHACVLNIHQESVTIRENESSVAEKGFELGYIKPNPPKTRTGKKVAVIGSGPAGLACADLLNKWGHTVTVFEKDDAVGGLLRYGIPDFKLNKKLIDRRLEILIDEGMNIKTNTGVGVDITGKDLMKEFDSIVLAIGAMQPRDLPIEGRDLDGVHFAMDFLTQQNKVVGGQKFPDEERILATDKNVVVIGGGDTGSDCVGTSARQKAKSITQIEIMPKPPDERQINNPWPYWANTIRTSSSHEEGCERQWSKATKRFIGDENGKLKQIEVVDVEWVKENGKFKMIEKEKTRKIIDAELVLLSMGFVHCVHEGLADELGLDYDMRGNIKIDKNGLTSSKKVFAAGDSVSGASLVVRAIAAGRKCAENVDKFLSE